MLQLSSVSSLKTSGSSFEVLAKILLSIEVSGFLALLSIAVLISLEAIMSVENTQYVGSCFKECNTQEIKRIFFFTADGLEIQNGFDHLPKVILKMSSILSWPFFRLAVGRRHWFLID